MAQWIRRLPTEQEIPGSSPGMDSLFFFSFVVSVFLPRPGLNALGTQGGWGRPGAPPRPRILHSKLVFVFTSFVTKLSFPGWRNWQRARLLTGRLRVRASLWEITFWFFLFFSFLFFSFLFFSFLFFSCLFFSFLFFSFLFFSFLFFSFLFFSFLFFSFLFFSFLFFSFLFVRYKRSKPTPLFRAG
jgi:hypothetical protein